MRYNTVKTMEYKARYLTNDIKLSCYEDTFFKSDNLFDCHMLVWFICGKTKIVQSDCTYFFKKEDIFLIPGNQLARLSIIPATGSLIRLW